MHVFDALHCLYLLLWLFAVSDSPILTVVGNNDAKFSFIKT